MPGPLLYLPPSRSVDFSTTPTGSNSRYTWTGAQGTSMGFDVGTGEFTLEMWVFQISLGGAGTFEEIMGKTNNLGNNGWDIERDNNGSTGYQMYFAGANPASLPAAAMQTGNWMYNAWARRGSTIDGWYSVGPNGSGGLIKSAALATSSANITATGNVLDIGAQSVFGLGARARIGLVRWWNRALTDGEFKYYWNKRVLRGVRYLGLRFMFDPTQDDLHSSASSGIGARNLVTFEVGTSGSLAVVQRGDGPPLIWDYGQDTFADVLARPEPNVHPLAPFIRISPPAGGGATTNTRTIPTSVVALQPTTRTVPTSVVALQVQTRTIPTSVVALQVSTRTIPTSVVALQPATRTIPTSVVALQPTTRTIPTSVVALQPTTRTIPTSVVALKVQTRTIPTSVVALQPTTRTIPTSVVALQPTTRTIPTSLVALQPTTRTIPTSVVASGGSPVRTIPTSVVALAVQTRTIPTSVVALAISTRTIPSSVVAYLIQTRTITTSVVALQPTTRTIPTNVVAKAISTRVIPSSLVAIMLGAKRTIPTSVVCYIPGAEITGSVGVTDYLVNTVSGTNFLNERVSATDSIRGTVGGKDYLP